MAPKKAALNQMINNIQSIDGHMTAEEVERHLKSRQSFMELVPERAPPTVPNEMFSNEPSLDSESNELIETSPSNIGEECLSVEYWNGVIVSDQVEHYIREIAIFIYNNNNNKLT